MLRGHDPDKLVNMSIYEREFHYEMMRLHYEEEAAKLKAMAGG